MRFADRLYSLALRACPRDFRDDNREEVLGTIADLRDAVIEAVVIAVARCESPVPLTLIGQLEENA